MKQNRLNYKYYYGLAGLSIVLFIIFSILRCEKKEVAEPDYPLEVIDNEIRVRETGEVLYRFIPVDGGAMEFDYIDSLVFRADTIGIHNNILKEIPSFLLGETPVTHRLWDYVMSNKKVLEKDDNQNWFIYYKDDVSALGWNLFLERLGNLTGRRFCLPSSFEWEFAARGGNKSKGCIYSGSDYIDEVALYNNNSSKRIVKRFGKQKKNNELGFYDMSGSVWELTTTKIGDLLPSNKMFEGIYEELTFGISRGGSWDSNAALCEVKSIDRHEIFMYTGARLKLVTNDINITELKHKTNDYIEKPPVELDVVVASYEMSLQHID